MGLSFSFQERRTSRPVYESKIKYIYSHFSCNIPKSDILALFLVRTRIELYIIKTIIFQSTVITCNTQIFVKMPERLDEVYFSQIFHFIYFLSISCDEYTSVVSSGLIYRPWISFLFRPIESERFVLDPFPSIQLHISYHIKMGFNCTSY